jgi:tetratricopeptide (TPR) repeat protein
VKPVLMMTTVVLLASAGSAHAQDLATQAFRAQVRAVCADPGTSENSASEFRRIERELATLPACGVDAETATAVACLREIAGQLATLSDHARRHRERHGDPGRVFVESMVRGLASEPFALGSEWTTSRNDLEADLRSVRDAWDEFRFCWPDLTCDLDERCGLVLSAAHTALRRDDKVVSAAYLGMARAESGKPEELIADCDDRLARNPKDATAYYLRAAARVAAHGSPQDAIADATEALRREPNFAFARALRARMSGAIGEYAAAREDCAIVLKEIPGCSHALATRALIHAREERFAEAVADASAALKTNPLSAPAYAARGWGRGGLGDHETAVEDFSMSIALGLDSPWVYSNRGTAEMNLGRREEALDDFTRAIREAPDDAHAYKSRGRAHAALQQFDAALTDLNRALKLAPDDADGFSVRGFVYCCRNEFDRGLDDFNAALRREPDNARTHGLRGDVYRNRGDFPKALADFDAAAHADPTSGSFRTARAAVLTELGQHDKAIAECNEALRLGDERGLPYAVRGWARLSRGEPAEALADSQEALRRDPQSTVALRVRDKAESQLAAQVKTPGLPPLPTAPTPAVTKTDLPLPPVTGVGTATHAEESGTGDDQYDRGSFLLKTGDFNGAVLAFNKAIRADPEDAMAYLKRGAAYAALDENKDALSDLSKSIELNAKNSKAYVYRAALRMRLKDYAGAVEDASAVIKLDPNNAEGYQLRGNAHDEAGSYAKALADFREGLRLTPLDAQSYNSVAWILATCPDDKVRDGKQAIEHAERACVLSGWTNGNIVDTLGAAYASAGDFENAVTWQTRAVELAPDKQKRDFRERLELYKAKKSYRKGE